MTSAVDVTFPPSNEKTSKSEMRAQMLIIANEITALQARTSLAGIQAYFSFVTPQEVENAILSHHVDEHNYARDIAFGRISL